MTDGSGQFLLMTGFLYVIITEELSSSSLLLFELSLPPCAHDKNAKKQC